MKKKWSLRGGRTPRFILIALLVVVCLVGSGCKKDAPIAAFTSSKTILTAGTDVQFTDQSANVPTGWNWNFGDGGTSTLQNPSHAFLTGGSYTISLTASNSGGSNTFTKTNYITVGNVLVADFQVSHIINSKYQSVQFTDQSTNNPTNWRWDFGDGETSMLQHPSHYYSTVGFKTITLTVSNAYGTDTKKATNYIRVTDAIFNPDLTYDTVSDIDGNAYRTIHIDDKIWMAENLKTTRYNDGTTIPRVTDYYEWLSLSSPARCWYNNDAGFSNASYGRLYNWYAISDFNGDLNICPSGWHVATLFEWQHLMVYMGGYLVSGGKIKETGTRHWDYPNTGATNESGFTALPAGGRYEDNNDGFAGNGSFSGFWTGCYGEFEGEGVIFWLQDTTSQFYQNAADYHFGFSVRCVKD